MQRPIVVLPQPLSPTKPRVSPERTEKLTSSTARTFPTTWRVNPLRMGKCIFKFSTDSRTFGLEGDEAAMSFSIKHAADHAARFQLPERDLLLIAESWLELVAARV